MGTRALLLARLGATAYFVWGLLHLKAAQAVFQLGGTLPPGMIQARVYQDAALLLACALAVMAVAATLNWRNRLTGHWINLGVVSAADVGFIAFVLAPGYIALLPGIAGPVLWLLGWALTNAARPWAVAKV